MRISMLNKDALPLYTVTDEESILQEATHLRDDGRIEIDLDSKLGRTFSKLYKHEKGDPTPEYQEVADVPNHIPPLNIVIQAVGSRGDIQPFVALGVELLKSGHRVRLATHAMFEAFVRTSGLEFYSIGGDPVELMAFMVKNPGLIPNMKSLKGGEIQKKRLMIQEMLEGCWESCIQPDAVSKKPFVAEAIIANPPSFAHVHCAQALSIPLHLMFTMPWTATSAFSHPLAALKATKVEPRFANYLSYRVVDWMTWQGLGDVINSWRKRLDLEEIPAGAGPFLADVLKIPFTYCWSPALVPKPKDWAPNIDVCGFFFREPAAYGPPADLEKFLRSGPRPVYIGFGSIVIDDPDRLTAIILKAITISGTRAIISRGWSKLGTGFESNSDVFYLDDCPHEWLFQYVAAVVHHGGAGTTACGLMNARPTSIIPFFGDQPFWGNMVAAAGAGPAPIPYSALTVDILVDAIRFCLLDSTTLAAKAIAEKMQVENGVKAAVASFHRSLPATNQCCDVMRNARAAWIYNKSKVPIRLSKLAAEVLLEYVKIEQKDLKLICSSPIFIPIDRWDPVTGSTSALLGTTTDMVVSVAGIATGPISVYNKARSDRKTNPEMKENTAKLSLDMASASAASVGMCIAHLYKGTMVDMPLAVTEGLRSTPKLYGEKVPDHGIVSDISSGLVVAGKSFAQGMYDGLTDIITQPTKGLREEGALGLVKGLGKGSAALVTKTSAAALGLVAYPAQGLCKSIHLATHTKTRKSIVLAARREGAYLERAAEERSGVNCVAVVDAFDRLVSAGGVAAASRA